MGVSKSLKLAVVHDDFIQEGGAERLVLAMLEIWPQADLFATVVTDWWKEEIRRLTGKRIRTSWLQSFPFKGRFYRYYYSLYPFAVESFNFDGYDVVLSSSARYAHGILTKPPVPHIAYVNSPARFLWEEKQVPKNPLAKPIIRWHRRWDRVASQRPDFIIANSSTPAARIGKFWGRKTDAIIYPFVDIRDPSPSGRARKEDYFLLIGRLNQWKRVDIAVRAFSNLGRRLYIIGNGPERYHLEGMAGPTVKFLGRVAESEKIEFLRSCRALVVPQEEDFGIVTLEANATGTPVIAFRGGGSLELVEPGVNGIFFDAQTEGSLSSAVERFDQMTFNMENCLNVAKRYGKERFREELECFVDLSLRNYLKRL